MNWWSLLGRSTTVADRWLMLVSATGIVAGVLWPLWQPASHARVAVNNQPVMRLNLREEGRFPVSGRLGPVVVEVAQGRVRLVEYDSPRMIGTRTGWIRAAGQVAACVPCGVMIQVEGGMEGDYDAVSH